MSANPNAPRRVSLIVPTFNEQGAIATVLDDLRRILSSAGLAAWEILVVDDGSTDETVSAVRLGEGVALLRHPRRLGYGAALKTGIRRAAYDWIAITDADGTYPNERLPDLFAAAGEATMVVGARTAEGARHPRFRRLPKAFLRRYAEWITHSRIEDMNSGLRVFRRDVAERLLHLLPDGFSFTTTITIAMLTNHWGVAYVPVSYAPRVGRSKIRPIRDTLGFLMLIVRTGTYFAPFRIFMPIAAVLAIAFTTSALYDILALDNLTDKTLILLTLTTHVAGFALLADMIHKRSGG